MNIILPDGFFQPVQSIIYILRNSFACKEQLAQGVLCVAVTFSGSRQKTVYRFFDIVLLELFIQIQFAEAIQRVGIIKLGSFSK